MSEIQLGKGSKNQGVVNTETFKGGIKREQLQSEAQKSIFDAVDIDKNGILDANEMQQFTAKLQDAAGNEKLSKREAGKFLKNADLKGIDKKELFNFVNQLSQNSENITSSQVSEQDGKKTIVITYKDGSVETVNPDKTSNIRTKGANDTVNTKFFDEAKNLTKEQTVQANGDTEVTEFKNNQPQTKTLTQNNGTKSTVINYQDGKEQNCTVKEGQVQSYYEYQDGKPVLLQKKENMGQDMTRETNYTYGKDGSVTEDIKEPGKHTVRVTKDNKPVSEVITEKDKTTERVHRDDETMLERVTQGDNHVTATVYNSKNKKLEQCVIKNGQKYTLEYDGEGNTKGIVVQNGESIAALAKKFHCGEQEIINLNKDVLNGKKSFNVGDKVKIPGELNADAQALQGRKSSEEAIHEYEQVQARKAAARAQRQAELKALGVVSTKGAGETRVGYVGQENRGTRRKSNIKYTVVGQTNVRGREIVKGSDGKYYTMAHDGTILKEEYAKNTSLYDSGKKIKGTLREKQQDGSFKEVQRDYVAVDKLEHGRMAVVDKNGKVHIMSHDGKILNGTYLQRSKEADEILRDPKKAQQKAISLMGSQVSKAEAAFNQQLKEDGWAGDVADGVSVLWGSKNRAPVIRKELAQYKSDLAELQKYSNSGNVERFKAKFKEMYGVEYNQNAVANYVKVPTSANFRKAFGTTNDIGLRIAKYNESQQTGAAVVKTGVVIAASTAAAIATGGTSLLAQAAIVGAATAAARTTVEVTNLATNKIDGDINMKNLDSIAQQAMKEGVITGATMGVIRGAGGIISKAAPKTTGGTPAVVPKATGGQPGLVKVPPGSTGSAGNAGRGAANAAEETTANAGRAGSANSTGNAGSAGRTGSANSTGNAGSAGRTGSANSTGRANNAGNSAGASSPETKVANEFLDKISKPGGLNNLSQAEKTKLADMLGITPDKLANLSKTEWRQLIVKFHPDKYAGNTEFANKMSNIINILFGKA